MPEDLNMVLMRTQADLIRARRERDAQKTTADALGAALSVAETLIADLRTELADLTFEANNLHDAVRVFAMENQW